MASLPCHKAWMVRRRPHHETAQETRTGKMRAQIPVALKSVLNSHAARACTGTAQTCVPACPRGAQRAAAASIERPLIAAAHAGHQATPPAFLGTVSALVRSTAAGSPFADERAERLIGEQATYKRPCCGHARVLGADAAAGVASDLFFARSRFKICLRSLLQIQLQARAWARGRHKQRALMSVLGAAFCQVIGAGAG